MFEEKSPKLDALLHHFQAKYKADPQNLRNAMPPQEMWRYFVEESKLLYVWREFEDNEPGYLLNLMDAFHLIFNPAQELNLTFIKKLHLKATQNVENTNYDSCWYFWHQNRKGEFRTTIGAGFGLGPHNCSYEGIKEFLDENKKEENYHLAFTINNSENKSEQVCLAVNRDIHFITPETKLDNTLYDIMLLSGRAKLFSNLVTETASSKTNIEILNDIMRKMISKFNLDIAGATLAEKKLEIIVRFIRNCVQLHPFADGNCRTFCMLLLNFLLLKNGFPLTLLKDPNIFGCYAAAELMKATIKGMHMSFQLITEFNNYDLFFPSLIGEEFTSKQKIYIAKIFDTEKNNRKQLEYKEKVHNPIVSPSLKRWMFNQVGFFAIGTACAIIMANKISPFISKNNP